MFSTNQHPGRRLKVVLSKKMIAFFITPPSACLRQQTDNPRTNVLQNQRLCFLTWRSLTTLEVLHHIGSVPLYTILVHSTTWLTAWQVDFPTNRYHNESFAQHSTTWAICIMNLDAIRRRESISTIFLPTSSH
jgi:hypothetical protein